MARPLTPMEWWAAHGMDAAQKLCEECGTSYAYFKHIAHGRRRPSIDLARAMERHSHGQMTVETLIPPRKASDD